MARKVEDWTRHAFGPVRCFMEQWIGKVERDIVIGLSAILDALLADLVVLGLRDDPKEAASFVGLGGDGRAPVGTFGARIQAAYLLGLVDRHNFEILGAIKKVRNHFAHRAYPNFDDDAVVRYMRDLVIVTVKMPMRRRRNRVYPSREEFVLGVVKSFPKRDARIGFFIGASALQTRNLRRLISRRRSRRKAAGKSPLS